MTKKMKDLVEEVEVQTQKDREDAARKYLHEVKENVERMEYLAQEARKKYDELLEMDVDEIGQDVLAMNNRSNFSITCRNTFPKFPTWPSKLPL